MAISRISVVALVLYLGCVRAGVLASSAPLYCSYDEPENHFECDYDMMSDPANRPIDFTQFDPEPQRLTMYVNGYFPYFGDTQVFSPEFANISIAGFDSNYPASLTIDCGWYGSVYFQAGAFANMSYIQHLKIRNCYTYNIPAEAFKELINLDYLSFEGGAIDLVDANAMAAVSVEKLDFETHTFPQPLGHFEVKNCKFLIKYVPAGLLFNWKNLTSVSLRNSELSTVSADTFRYTTKLRSIDLSHNLFSSIPTGLFDGLDSLAEVHLHNIDWYCTCSDLWWYSYLKERNVTIFGELVCDDPSGTTVGKYWNDECVELDLCEGQTGVEWKEKNTCITIFDFLRYGYALTAFCVMVPSLGLAIHAKRQASAGGGRQNGGPKGGNAFAMANIKKSRRVSDIDMENENRDGDRKRRKGKDRRHRDRDDGDRDRDRNRDRRRDKRGRDRRRDEGIEEDLTLPD